MNLLQVVPDSTYFVWQLYVQMYNFRKFNLEKDAIILVAIHPNSGHKPSPEMERFAKWTKAQVHYFLDTRTEKNYPSSVRPHLIAKYMRHFGAPKRFFYHDQDIIFLREPQLVEAIHEGIEVCYVAPGAKSYLHTPYIKQFKPYIYPSMCEIVGISPKLVEDNDINCGGAQYIIEGTDAAFWEKVERDSNGIWQYCHDVCKDGLLKYNPDQKLDKHKIQYWCADMWALFWNLLLSDKLVCPLDSIDFSWPWEKISESKPIMHNAGITDKTQYVNKVQTYFYKSGYNSRMPFGEDTSFVPSDCVQHPYVQIIRELRDYGII